MRKLAWSSAAIIACALGGACSSDDDGGGGGSSDASADVASETGSDAQLPDGAADAGADATAEGGSDASPDGEADGGDGGLAQWGPPACTSVSGTGAVTFSSDHGATLAPMSEAIGGVTYTMGLVALDLPNTLLASSGGTLLRSEDAGCNWTTVTTLPSSILSLSKGVGDRAWGWVDNDQPLVRIDGSTITSLKNPAPGTLGLIADPNDADRVRLGGSDGSLWESTDAGQTWDPIGVPPTSSSALLAYRFDFDPNDLDHVIFGAATEGAHVTFDGGKTWTKSTGISPSGKANAFEFAISPADSNVVWLEGLDLDENLAGTSPTEGRHIWRSTDGGKSFVPVVDHEPGTVPLTNGLPMFAHPTDPNVLYFEFGTYFQGYGTDLFRYDAGSDQLTQTHNAFHDVLVLAFSPADAGILYLGVSSTQIQ